MQVQVKLTPIDSRMCQFASEYYTIVRIEVVSKSMKLEHVKFTLAGFLISSIASNHYVRISRNTCIHMQRLG